MGVKEIGVYKLGRTLGEGTFGKVKWGVNSQTGQEVAIKIMKPQEVKDKKDIEREISILKLLKHPNIVDLYEVIHDNEGRIYLVLELITGGEMFDYIVTRGKIKEREAKKFFRQVVSAVEYCHGNLIVHRDLKPENLLLDSDGNVKINDFGFSNVIKPGKLFSTFCGSPLYAAPEIFLAKEYIGPEVDIWSMGVILYVLVFGQLPWAVGRDGKVDDLESLLQAKYEIPASDVSRECVDLISKMIVPKRKQRITIEEIRNHPWIQDASGPPPCLLPARAPVVEVNKKILEQMALIGFDMKVAEQQVLSNERCTAVSTYHMLLARAASELPPAVKPLGPPMPVIKSESMLSKVLHSSPPEPDMSLRPRRSSFYLPSTVVPTSPTIAPPSPLAQSTRFGIAKKLDTPPSPTAAFMSPGSPVLLEPRRARALTADSKKRFSLPVELTQAPKALSSSPPSSQNTSPQLKPKKGSRILTGLFKKKTKPEDILAPNSPGSPEKDKNKPPQSPQTNNLRRLPSLKLSINRKPEKIRSTKGIFNVDTTSSKSPADIIAEIQRVLFLHTLEVTLEGYIFYCKQRAATPDRDNKKLKTLQFDVEVCQIKGLSMHGVKFKRVAGDVWEYRNMCQTVISQLKL